MKVQFLEYQLLVCPYCVRQSNGEDILLRLIRERAVIDGDDIREGNLFCCNCSRSYEITEGVAVFPTPQGQTKYDQRAVAEIYVQTQYRDVLAKSEELRGSLKSNDATGFFIEPKTGDESHPSSNYYLELAGLPGERVTGESVVIDIGCSVGRLSRELARKAKLVIGVDLSFTQVKIARELLLTGVTSISLSPCRVSGSTVEDEEVSVRLEDESASNVEFIVADAALLPFRDGAFDAICASAVIQRVPDAENFILNVKRLSHDGTLLLITSPFDWNDKYSPKESWLGFRAFGTSEGTSENALKELLQRHQFRFLKERNIPWTTLSDRRHHSVWSVYSCIFEYYCYSLRRLNPQSDVTESLVETYQRIFKESPAFQEIVSKEMAREAFEAMELLLVAERQSNAQPIGFAGGRDIRESIRKVRDEEVRKAKEKAYEALKGLSNNQNFYINELGVLSEYGGAGVGGKLLDSLISHARVKGYHSFSLVTAYDNPQAISLYRRRGFSFLSNSDGLLRRPVKELRESGKVETDLRPYLYRVDEFVRIAELKNGREAFLELIRPASMSSDDLLPVAQTISEIFGRAFWHSDDAAKRWPVADIMRRLPKAQLVIIAFDESRETVGYSIFNRLTWESETILFADSCGVSGGSPDYPADWQTSGLGSHMLREALRQLHCSIVAARTQNAAIVPILRKLNPEQILPIDSPYSGKFQRLLVALGKQVPELVDGELIPEMGIYKRIYGEGLLGDYELKVHTTQLKQFEETMTRLDGTWNRVEGDAVILMATGIPHDSYAEQR